MMQPIHSDISEQGAGPSTNAILLVLLFVVVGTTVNDGLFSWHGLVLLTIGTGLGIFFHLYPLNQRVAGQQLLPMVVVIFLALACLFMSSGGNETKYVYFIEFGDQRIPKSGLNAFGLTIKILTALALGVAVAYWAGLRGRMRRYFFAAMVAMAVAARVLMLFSTPIPKIDVFVSQTYGGAGLLEKKNVYAMEFPSPYARVPFTDEQGIRRIVQVVPVFDKDGFPHEFKETPEYRQALRKKPVWGKALGRKLDLTFDHYGYPPATVYCNFISWNLFKDVRGVWLICDLIAALCIYLVARRMSPWPQHRRFCELVTLAFLFLPRTLYVLEQSWTEPLVTAALGLVAAAMAYGRGPALSGCMLGLWLTSKQYVVVGLPLILKLRRLRVWAWVWAAALAGVLVLPFAVWDFGALWHDVFGFFTTSDPRPDALSIYGVFARQGWDVPWWVVAPLWLAGLAFFTWKMRRTLAGWLFSTACMWLFFFMFGKQAFMNYFHLIAFTLLLAAAASPQRAKSQPVPQT